MANPFEGGTVDNFPPFKNIFENSPSIDTIARTQPDFSLHSCDSSRTAGPHKSPSGSGQRCVHSDLPSRSPLHPRPRAAKQLNFSREPGSREGCVSRSTAAAAGWPTPSRRPVSASSSGNAGNSCVLAPASATSDAPAPSARVAPSSPSAPGAHGGLLVHGGVTVQTAIAPNASETIAPSATEGAGTAQSATLPRLGSLSASLPLRARFDAVASGMPRSPSAPVLRSTEAGVPPQRSAATTAPQHDGTHAEAAHAPPTVPLADRLEEARRALLQPPTFAFTQYLHGLLQRWPRRPLAPSLVAELGLSPAKPRSHGWAGGSVDPGMDHLRHTWPPPSGTAPPPMPSWPYHAPAAFWPMMAPSVVPMVTPMTPPLHMPPAHPSAHAYLPPPYWGAPQHSWPPMWPMAPPPPPLQPYSLYHHSYAPAPPHHLYSSSSTPYMYPGGPTAFSTANLPASRHLFKYVQ
jgi:hypothetical protein